MCELTIEVKAPFNIAVFIDGEQYSVDETGLCKAFLDTEAKHKLEIRVERKELKNNKFFNKAVSLFKLKGRHTDSFDNVFYKTDFTLAQNRSTAKIIFEYKKFTTLNFHKKEIQVPYISVLRKSKIDIINEEKRVFKDKKDFFAYFVRNRWIEIVIAVIMSLVILSGIFTTFFENQNDLYKPFEIVISFANTPFEAIIEGTVLCLLWLLYWIVDMILFVRRSLKISKWTKDKDDKSTFFYKTKFFV